MRHAHHPVAHRHELLTGASLRGQQPIQDWHGEVPWLVASEVDARPRIVRDPEPAPQHNVLGRQRCDPSVQTASCAARQIRTWRVHADIRVRARPVGRQPGKAARHRRGASTNRRLWVLRGQRRATSLPEILLAQGWYEHATRELVQTTSADRVVDLVLAQALVAKRPAVPPCRLGHAPTVLAWPCRLAGVVGECGRGATVWTAVAAQIANDHDVGGRHRSSSDHETPAYVMIVARGAA